MFCLILLVENYLSLDLVIYLSSFLYCILAAKTRTMKSNLLFHLHRSFDCSFDISKTDDAIYLRFVLFPQLSEF